jgi:hypothetical protein
MTLLVAPSRRAAGAESIPLSSGAVAQGEEHDVGEFNDEVTVLSRWLGRDVVADLEGVVPIWNAFRFRDATVFASEVSDGAARMYLVRGELVHDFVPSQVTIDEAYAQLTVEDALAAAA